VVDDRRRQALLLSYCPEECVTLSQARKSLLTQCSHNASRSAVVADAAASVAVTTAGVGRRLAL
jgi:hypothetical protein